MQLTSKDISFDFSKAPTLNGRWRRESSGEEEAIAAGVIDAAI